MTARAFILENGRLSTDAAEEHAHRVFLYERLPNPLMPDKLLVELREKLIEYNFDPEADFLVLTGSPVHLAMMTLAAMDLSPWDKLNILVFDSRSDNYVAKEVALPCPS